MVTLRDLWRTAFIVGAALGFGLCVILLASERPGDAIYAFFLGPFSNAYFFGNLLASAIPLILTGAAACVSFSASVFNLGLEGQVYLGSFLGVFLTCLLYTSDAADDLLCVDLGGRRIIQKTKNTRNTTSRDSYPEYKLCPT